MQNNVAPHRNKILAIIPRLPASSGNKKDARLINMLKYFSRNNTVHLLYVQSSDGEGDSKKVFETNNIEVFSIKEKRKPGIYNLDIQLKELLCDGSYDTVFLNGYYSAKYYLPYIEEYVPETIVVIDGAGSQLAMDAAYTCKGWPTEGGSQYSESAKIQESSVFSHADTVFLENDEGLEEIKRLLPAVCFRPVSNEELSSQDGAGKFDRFVKRPRRNLRMIEMDALMVRDSGSQHDSAVEVKNRAVLTAGYKTNIMVSDGPLLVKSINEALKRTKGEYILLIAQNTLINDRAIAGLLYCSQVNPQNAIIAPSSNYSINISVNREHYDDFIEKHYKANFGYWNRSKYISEKCMLIRNELFAKIGFLDERFRTLEYACMDYCLRAFQSNYKSILVNESFIFNSDRNGSSKASKSLDEKHIYAKWGSAGMEFLEIMGEL